VLTAYNRCSILISVLEYFIGEAHFNLFNDHKHSIDLSQRSYQGHIPTHSLISTQAENSCEQMKHTIRGWRKFTFFQGHGNHIRECPVII
jgi:hypothetical protein